MDAQPDDRPVKLGVVELLDRDDHVQMAVSVWRWPVTIGRAIDCDVVLADPHAAAQHASIVEDEGTLALTVSETINGVRVRRQRITSAQRVELGTNETFQIGHSRLRVRRAADALAPEVPLAPEAPRSRVPVGALVLAVIVWSAGRLWLNANPGSPLTDYLPLLIGGLLAQAVWAGLWAVGSKLVRHRFDFWGHARIAFGYTLAANVATLVLPLIAFSLGWSFLSRISLIVAAALGWAAVTAHLGRVFPARPRVLAGVMTTLFLAGLSLFLFRNYQVHDRVFSELYVTTLAPPVLRVAPTVDTSRFIDEARALKAVLDAHAKDDDGESPARPGE